MSRHICNAIIQKAEIQLDRGVFLSCWLALDFGGTGQSFGGYVLGGDTTTKSGRHDEQPNLAGEFIVSCLRAAGVEEFSKLAGKTIRVERTEEGLGGTITGIGHIVRDDRWFRPKERFEEMLAKHKAAA